MTNPKISDAKRICQALQARSVILIVIDKDRYGAVSYGETKAECTMTGRILDRICEKVLFES